MKLISALLPLLAGMAVALPSSSSSSESPRLLEPRQRTLCSQCNPLPELNTCHPTTSCIMNMGNRGPDRPYYCACRAGYKADPQQYAGDYSAQFRVSNWPEQRFRVFVRPGIACDTLCDDWTEGADSCSEVYQNPYCA